jgi:sulfite dehydrogenase (quinone) subunit SoeC
MHPAFSVIFLTTLIGAGQGLMVALVMGQIYLALGSAGLSESGGFYVGGAFLALVFLGLGLLASFFHLANPQRAWRAASQWRTSWLSREVLALPAAMGLTALYGLLHLIGWNPALIAFSTGGVLGLTIAFGLLAVVACFALFVCTGMIYACVKFIREWAGPLTVVNYTLMGLASGFTLAAAYASAFGAHLTGLFGGFALVFTIAALATRGWHLLRNRRLKPVATLKGAIGAHHQNIRQVSQGFMGSSFNTTEFVHGKSPETIRLLVVFFLAAGFAAPIVLLGVGLGGAFALLWVAFAVQYVGLMAERWVFFAQGNHVQNLYYQRKA